MNLSTTDLAALADIAIAAATEAGEMVARERPQQVEHKEGATSLASQVVTEIDRRSEDMILDVLRPTLERYELGLLTEEQVDDQSRLTADYFWCIDPIDGTLSFIEGTPGYAVSIALVSRDGEPAIGVVYDPVEATIMHAIAGGGAFRNGEPLVFEPEQAALNSQGSALSLITDRSFLEWDNRDEVVRALDELAKGMGLTGVQVDVFGGAVMNACRVLANPPACYFKPASPVLGGASIWDYAATACLFHEAGAIATNIDGAPIDLNRSDATYMNHGGVLFATDEALAIGIRTLFT